MLCDVHLLTQTPFGSPRIGGDVTLYRGSQELSNANWYLPVINSAAILAFSSDAIYMTPMDELDPLAPQREAAFFYGLFLRGYPVEVLRQDIDVPRPMLDKWLKAKDFEDHFRDSLKR